MILQPSLKDMTREKVVGLTYRGLQDAPFGRTSHLTNWAKFCCAAAERAGQWGVDQLIVYKLFDAYLRFEDAKPVSVDEFCVPR